jgi:PBSX family phage portal protein
MARAKAAGQAPAATVDGAEAAIRKQVDGRERIARSVRAVVLRPDVIRKAVSDRGATKAEPTDDPFGNLQRDGRIVEPPFDPLVLAQLVEYSSELGPCIEAMEVNCDAYGYTLRQLVGTLGEEIPEELKKEIRKERVRLRNFFRASYDDGFTALRRLMRKDLEGTGNAYWEVARNAADKIDAFYHLPSYQMRLGIQDTDLTEYEQVIPIESEDAEGVWTNQKRKAARRFRRYVQWRPGAARPAWFKEFGDPRDLDRETGEYAKPGTRLPFEKRASEIMHWRLYSSRTPYGLPRFIGNLLSIYGSRGAEEINFITFRNNNVPSMFVLVSDGILTDASVERLRKLIETQVKGSDNYSKVVILEAEGIDEPDDIRGGRAHPKIEIKPLSDQQIRDAMFIEYDKANQEKIRRSFRLPPIFTGRSEDYNRATADASTKLAERQVFGPERAAFDAVINLRLLPHLNVRYHEFRSNGPPVAATDDLVNVMGAAERSGAMTPRIGREILEEIAGREFGAIGSGLEPDTPFSLTMAREVKNVGPMTQGQVTALKRLGDVSFLEAIAMARGALEEEVRWRSDHLPMARAS